MRIGVLFFKDLHINFGVVKIFDRDRHVLAVIEQRVRIGRHFCSVGLMESSDSRWRLREKQSDKFVEFNLWQFGRIHDGKTG